MNEVKTEKKKRQRIGSDDVSTKTFNQQTQQSRDVFNGENYFISTEKSTNNLNLFTNLGKNFIQDARITFSQN